MLKRSILFTVLVIVVLGTIPCFAGTITTNSEKESYAQYYATDNWLSPGIYRIEGRITKNIDNNGDYGYWLNVNARGRSDGFTTKAQIKIGEKVYDLKCVDIISAKYRDSMSKKSNSNLTLIQEFYDIDPNIIKEISLTSQPISIIVNFKNRPDVYLKVKGDFLNNLRELNNLRYQDKGKYLEG